MSQTESHHPPDTTSRPWWRRIPLTLQIVIALILAVILGISLGAGNPSPSNAAFITNLAIPAELVLKALRALATPLILVAVLHTFMTANIPGTAGRRLALLLVTNTTVAILIGLLVANVLRPGTWGSLPKPQTTIANANIDPWGLLRDAVPEAVLAPLVSNNVIQLIIVALCFGIVLRGLKSEQITQNKTGFQPIEDVIGILFEAVIRILNWVIALVPFAVFGIVAKTVAEKGFAPFISLAAFIVAVLVALLLQACYYLTRVKFGSWVNPLRFLAGGSDAFITAFSTSSSTVTMPITWEVLQTKVGLRESSASLGALVGANFNNDGTALYEAMSALYISQVIGQHLNLGQQLIVVLTSIFASVGAAGIPNAGLVTMTLVFTSVRLPTEYIALLVTVDWFLDRCRTAINVMGDMTVSAVLDGKKPRYEDEG
ncbi:dicarboxylate/amino acid:cation symporter [Nostoc sp. FACHB-152]|uniref:dicarboxylate/amino acid:cation symporter n=1 Tax=unclassified Nostoc TaxID=2593658 RepID=UPI0016869E37|nr:MULTISPECIES: dicarboxylate/amino acid:cation symporter [unclassified Nostoc]MBD2451358.1 dicarboxylate/amino acid:cation symporter [Nostoc sp. FACHB-152]MBD2472033.1 dicarboxylate/amino acid:cation symporter [Nostoc sp. FACHB-145]